MEIFVERHIFYTRELDEILVFRTVLIFEVV